MSEAEMSDQKAMRVRDSLSSSGEGAGFRTTMNLTASQIQQEKNIFREWEDGPFAHLTKVSIPHLAAGNGFRFAATGQSFDELMSAKVYCDSLTGISGKQDEQDPIVVDFVSSGWLEFTGKKGTSRVEPGRLCIRDTSAPWEFSCGPEARLRVVTIPRKSLLAHLRSGRALNRPFVADVGTPEVQFLLNILEVIQQSGQDLDRSTTAQGMAADACAAILARMLSGRADDMAAFSNVTVEAAKSFIEKNIIIADLSPSMIAQTLGVSLRTLHRSFAETDDSVMALVRRRRLQGAHDELLRTGSAISVSEIAARWHFSDASHFIRQFKSSYGASPAAYLRRFQQGERP
ncbi:AraC family transcriptional regulator [Streptomyces sp. NPDC004096]|uniref:AraC family transcriptional regulator n=1 Tax=unclassified Streptomyces TaxID=2593676 RepID=UPI0033BFA933